MVVRFASLVLLMVFSGNLAEDYDEPNFEKGRSTIVQLFEWKWNDIADECEQFLGPYGYAGVQVSPPNEHAVILEPSWNRNITRPWFERYQPVSYKLVSRSGNETEFREMVERCNEVGVRIYVDIVINRMTGDIGAGHGTAGSFFDPAVPEYDGVPYGPYNFKIGDKCPTGSGDIEDYNNKIEVRNCRLSGVADLDLDQEYVREKVTEYMNKLIEIGVAGFRVDTAKNMSPEALAVIYGRLRNLNQEPFGYRRKPFIYQEVIALGGEDIKSDQYAEFGFGMYLGNIFRKNDNQKLSDFFYRSISSAVFVDNHVSQRNNGAAGYSSILTHRQPRMYKMAVALMQAWPQRATRVMSSFSWPEHIVNGRDVNDWIGPPHDENYNIKSVNENSHSLCGCGWICEHRWRQIYSMVQFRNAVGSRGISETWDNGNNQIAFSRGSKGYIAINNDDYPLDEWLYTRLPRGTYCDVISGNKVGNRCTGRAVQVGEDGRAHIRVDNSWSDPMIAIHVEAKLSDIRDI